MVSSETGGSDAAVGVALLDGLGLTLLVALVVAAVEEASAFPAQAARDRASRMDGITAVFMIPPICK